MASYGIPPQLYPYLYAPKAASLGLHSPQESPSEVIRQHHKKHFDDSDEKNNDEILSVKGDDENLDENENVEID